MNKYIRTDKLLDVVRKRARYLEEDGEYEGDGLLLGDIELIISELPAENVAPVVHGRWIFNTVCSECGVRFIRNFDYCPRCGAKMDIRSKLW